MKVVAGAPRSRAVLDAGRRPKVFGMQSEPAEAAPRVWRFPFPAAVPEAWRGTAQEDRRAADYAFPCIGDGCRQRTEWHEKGTWCQPFFDASLILERRRCQHMCLPCVNALMRRLLKELAEGNLRYVEEERERGGSSSDPVFALPAPLLAAPPPPAALPPPADAPPPDDKRLMLTSPVGTAAPAIATAMVAHGPATPTVLAFDFSAALSNPKEEAAKQKKRSRDSRYVDKKKKAKVSVHRDEINGIDGRKRIDTKILERVAKYLGASYKRGNGRTWDTVRDGVLDRWPDDQELIDLEGAQSWRSFLSILAA